MKIRGCAATVKPENFFSRAGVFYESFCFAEQEKDFMNKKVLAIVIIIIIFALSALGVSEIKTFSHSIPNPTTTPVSQQTTLVYKGINGKDALTLLKEHAAVEQDHSGLVIGINGNKPTGHHYWAFYVNGKMSQVGPAEYQTKNSDIIEWKIEKY